MDDLFHYLWLLLLLFFHWLWSIREFLLFVAAFIWFQWMIKSTIREAVEEAMNKTVVPVLNDIYERLSESE